MMSEPLYIDIETIPTQRDDICDRIAKTVKAPGTIKKAESIAAWEAEQKPAAVMEAVAKTSFDGAYGHICCIGWASGDEDPQSVIVRDVKDEKEAISKFAFAVSHDNRGLPHAPLIVGHNVVNFDIRFLWQRAIVLGVRLPNWFPVDPKPWSNDVFDTMTKFAGPQGRISLDNLALALGIKGKGDVDGSMIAGMWAEGKHDEIAAYCKSDVALTREIHKRMKVAGL